MGDDFGEVVTVPSPELILVILEEGYTNESAPFAFQTSTKGLLEPDDRELA
jgi:hypothetical protein